MKILSLFENLRDELMLTFSLLRDKRVSNWAKLLPIGSFLYLILPDLLPGLIDDTVLVALAVFFFNYVFTPDEIVREHRNGAKENDAVFKKEK
jgi:uncharacterized membrane protein YkvA (DUF1232 family)